MTMWQSENSDEMQETDSVTWSESPRSPHIPNQPRPAVGSTPSRRQTRSYVVSVSSQFRDLVLNFAQQNRVGPSDLVRSVLLTTRQEELDACIDPGEPLEEDREQVLVQSGVSQGRILRRKPRLQIRLEVGLSMIAIRKTLKLAIDRHESNAELNIISFEKDADKNQIPEDSENTDNPSDFVLEEALETAHAELDRLYDTISSLSFVPLPNGVRTRAEALYVLGLPPSTRPNLDIIKERYRKMAKIHHPDNRIGNHARMAQLNEALQLLREAHFLF